MRSLVSVFLATMMVSAALGQSFTIVQPTDGSTVRENVKIRIPKGAIPDRAYIGVSVNGKFLEAARPPLVGDNYVYTLDTKERHIPDGDMDVEVVLYQDFNDRAEIVNRSSVRVKLDNYTSIKVPEDGLQMRYKFQKGKEYKYTINRYQTMGTLTQAQIAIGSRAGEVPVDSTTSRVLWAIDNVYDTSSGKQALLRVQSLPEKGKNYAMLRSDSDPELKKYYDFEMRPLYMRVDATGREVFGAAPPYFPLGEGTAEQSGTDFLSLAMPMPILPSKTLLPGDTWQASQLFSNIDLSKLDETDKLTEALASRGTFVGVEWEKGIPCAKFTVAVDAGPRELSNAVNLNNQPGESQRVSLIGTMWFALDRGVIVKSDITFLQESVVTIGTPQATGGNGGTNTAGGTGAGLPGATGAPGRSGGSGNGAAGVSNWFLPGSFVFSPHIDDHGRLWFFQGGPTFGGAGAAPSGANSGGGRTGGGSGGVRKQILRIRLRQTAELEN